MEATIDCRQIKTEREFYDAVMSQLRLTGFDMKSPDTLYGCLVSLRTRMTVNLIGVVPMLRNLGSYGRAAVNAIARAERENGAYLTVNML